MSAPSFLGIGVPRAGTTWLYNVLMLHPQIWMPPLKELHYFDVLDPTVNRNSFRKKHILSRIKHNLAFITSSFWNKFQPKVASNIKIDLYFDLYFLLSGYTFNENMYKNLFKRNYYLTGEITPSYSLLSKSYIKKMTQINDNIKILLLIRNPIDRSWSHTVKVLAREKGKNIEEVSEEKIINYLNTSELYNCSNYPKIINNYLSCIDRNQLYIGYYDDIINDPNKILKEICEFLNIEYKNEYFKSLINKSINSTSFYSSEIPLRYEKILTKMHYENLKELNEFLNGDVLNWINRAESVLQK